MEEAEEIKQEDLPDKCQSLRLRSIRKRLEIERKNKEVKEAQSSEAEGNATTRRRRVRRPPAAPLSKYRRKTANARERRRMQEVNEAFERLKSSIPHHTHFSKSLQQEAKAEIIVQEERKEDQEGEVKQEVKDTKITTLRCAISYIKSLSGLLEDLARGKLVSPDFYRTDEELGLRDNNVEEGKENKRKKRVKKKKSKRKKKESEKVKKKSPKPKLQGVDKATSIGLGGRRRRGLSSPYAKCLSREEIEAQLRASAASAAKSGHGQLLVAPVKLRPSQMAPVLAHSSATTVTIQLPQHPLPLTALHQPQLISPCSSSSSSPTPSSTTSSSSYLPENSFKTPLIDAWPSSSAAVIEDLIADVTPLTGLDCFVAGNGLLPVDALDVVLEDQRFDGSVVVVANQTATASTAAVGVSNKQASVMI